MDKASQFQTLDKAVYVSLRANAFEKAMNQYFLKGVSSWCNG